MSTLKVNNLQDINGTNNSTPSEVANGRAKAWVHFDGTFGSSPFTVGNGGIFDSYNVSSVTDSGTGKYVVNMSITMANINYAAFADGRFNLSDGDGSANLTLRRIAQTTTSYGIRCSDASANVYNPTFVTGVVFGD